MKLISDDDLKALTGPEIDELLSMIHRELNRRHSIETAEQRVAEIAREYGDATGRVAGAAWRQPQGAHDSYPPKAITSLDGQHYRNDHTGVNQWKPTDLNSQWTPVWEVDGKWVDTPPAAEGGGPAKWMAGVNYKVGDKVTHDGFIWECVLDHTSHDGWKPMAATYEVWKKLGPA